MTVGKFKSAANPRRHGGRANVTKMVVPTAVNVAEDRTEVLEDWSVATDWFVANARRQGHTPRSVQARMERLRLWAKFAGGTPGTLTTAIVKHYVDDALSRNLSHFTINCMLRTLRTFYSELRAEGLVDEGYNPATAVKKLKEPINTVIPLSQIEVRLLLQSFDLSSWPELRDYTITCLMLETGVRRTECLKARVQDLDFAEGSLFIPPENAKGRKARSVYFGERLSKMLKEWLEKRQVDCECLFPSVYLDLSGNYHSLSPKAFEKRLTVYGTRSGVSVHPHQLRHTFAVNYLRQSGGDLATCARQMGHSSVRVTERYLNVAESGVQRILVQQHSLLDHCEVEKPKRRRVDRGRRNLT